MAGKPFLEGAPRCGPGPCSRLGAARRPAPARPATPTDGLSPPARHATRESGPIPGRRMELDRVPPLNFSQPTTAIADATGVCDVRATAGRHVDPATSTRRSIPVRPLSLRSGSEAASSADTNRTRPDNPPTRHCPRLGSARLGRGHQRWRSMVALAAPRWSSRCGPDPPGYNAADSTCWPVCCCMWSKRRAQSTAPSTRAPTSRRSARARARPGHPRRPRRR